VFQITIGRTPPTKEHQWFSNGGLGSVPWLSIKDMDSNTTFLTKTSQYLTEEAVERFNIPLVEENDVLLSFKLTVGRVEISSIRMVTNEAIACFKADAYLRNYLYCYLKKCNFLSDGDNTSSIGQAVNSTIIKNFPFSVPTNASLAQFNEKTMPLFKLVMEKQKENILLKREKQALLIRYFGSH
jgi:type I restriction enzyme S subunit